VAFSLPTNSNLAFFSKADGSENYWLAGWHFSGIFEIKLALKFGHWHWPSKPALLSAV